MEEGDVRGLIPKEAIILARKLAKKQEDPSVLQLKLEPEVITLVDGTTFRRTEGHYPESVIVQLLTQAKKQVWTSAPCLYFNPTLLRKIAVAGGASGVVLINQGESEALVVLDVSDNRLIGLLMPMAPSDEGYKAQRISGLEKGKGNGEG